MTKNAKRMALYAACEDADGTTGTAACIRDDVDIFDTMSALVKYSTGATLNYSLNAFMPFEGYRLAFNGEQGTARGPLDHERQPWKSPDERHEIHLTKNFGQRVAVDGCRR